MSENKFFKWLWRINQIALMVGLFAFFWLFYTNEIRADRHHRPIAVPSPVVNELEGKNEFSFGSVIDVYGSGYSMISLIPKNKMMDGNRPYIYFEGMTYGGSANNILFLNKKDDSSSWLFKDNNQLIETYTIFPSTSEEEGDKNFKFRPLFIYYKMIDGDKKDIAISDISGKNYKLLVKGVDRILSVDKIDKEHVLFLYEKDTLGYAMRLSISDFEIISTKVLPKVGE